MTEIRDLFEYRWGEAEFAQVEDWVSVVSIDEGGGYDWAEFHSWYSPVARRYFWGSGAGCSCNYFAEGFSGFGDFASGDRPALMAAIREFADDHGYRIRPTELVDALMAANAFDPRKVARS